jgi:hypothetical protein
MTVPTEQRLVESAPIDNRAALTAKLRLLEVERRKTALTEANRVYLEHRERGVERGGMCLTAMATRMSEVAFEIGLQMIDASLETGVTDSAAITEHVLWDYDRYVSVHIPGRLRDPSMEPPSGHLELLLVQDGRARGYNLRHEVEARKHAFLAALAGRQPSVQTFNVVAGDGSQVQAGVHVSGHQSMVTYRQVLENMKAAIQHSTMPEAGKAAAIRRLTEFMSLPGIDGIANSVAVLPGERGQR